jgi:hypothetical protein
LFAPGKKATLRENFSGMPGASAGFRANPFNYSLEVSESKLRFGIAQKKLASHS